MSSSTADKCRHHYRGRRNAEVKTKSQTENTSNWRNTIHSPLYNPFITRMSSSTADKYRHHYRGKRNAEVKKEITNRNTSNWQNTIHSPLYNPFITRMSSSTADKCRHHCRGVSGITVRRREGATVWAQRVIAPSANNGDAAAPKVQTVAFLFWFFFFWRCKRKKNSNFIKELMKELEGVRRS